MYYTNCGCREIPHEPFEFKIETLPTKIIPSVILPNDTEEDWCRLRTKIICDFHDIIRQLECGIQPDVELLLEEISLMYINSNCSFSVTKQVSTTNPEDNNIFNFTNSSDEEKN